MTNVALSPPKAVFRSSQAFSPGLNDCAAVMETRHPAGHANESITYFQRVYSDLKHLRSRSNLYQKKKKKAPELHFFSLQSAVKIVQCSLLALAHCELKSGIYNINMKLKKAKSLKISNHGNTKQVQTRFMTLQCPLETVCVVLLCCFTHYRCFLIHKAFLWLVERSNICTAFL